MKDLSLTQQYMLCTLKENGKLPALGLEKTLCLSASGVLELLMEDILAFDGKKLRINGPLPQKKEYLSPVYEMIEKKQPVKFETVVEFFTVSLTDTNINRLIDHVGESLVQAGCVQKEKGGLFGGKNLYLPKQSDVDAVVQRIRAEILEDGEISEDIVALAALLHKSGDLQRYFSAYERKDFKQRMKEIKENPGSEMIRRAAEYIDSLLVLMIVAAT